MAAREMKWLVGAPIRLIGVRTHNLRNINVEIPLNRITVITGRSGAGKSSLALDTLFAEGQRRYVESLSTYARQFIQRMDRPDLDDAEGLLPAIAIRQHSYAKNPRSTVGTVTEVYDYLRLLFARLAVYICPDCQQPVRMDTPQSVWEWLLTTCTGSPVQVLAPVETDPADPISQIRELLEHGFYELYENGRRIPLHEIPARTWTDQPVRWLWLGQRRVDPNRRDAWMDLLDLAFARGHGRIAVIDEQGNWHHFSEALACARDGRTFPPMEPSLFSFNRPEGACPACQGFGDVAEIDWNKVIPDPNLPLRAHPIKPWNTEGLRHLYRYLFRAARRCGWDLDTPWKDLPASVRDAILNGNEHFFGLQYFFRRLQRKRYKRGVRIFLARYRSYRPCSQCGGTRLRPEASWARIDGVAITDVVRWPVQRIRRWVERLEMTPTQRHILARTYEELLRRLRYLDDVGLGYLTLDRLAGTLSGGEAQRIQMAIALGTALSDTLFILDEPSVGLHPRDTEKLVAILRQLRDQGNTVLVVEHDPEIIRAADHVIDLGPGAGHAGGALVYTGPPDGLTAVAESATGRYLQRFSAGAQRWRPLRRPRGWIRVRGARAFNLKSIDVDVPLNCLTVITGVSGSGKSTLLGAVLHPALRLHWGQPSPWPKQWATLEIEGPLAAVEYVDPLPPTRSPRATVLSYAGGLAHLRTWWVRVSGAARKGWQARHFSWNTPDGRCHTCRGLGYRKIEMLFMSDILLTCESCHGARLRPEVLELRWNGWNFADVLNWTADQACEYLQDASGVKPLVRACRALRAVGLGYLRLGQPLATLSGGEIQRLKLVRVLAGANPKPTLFLLDEPTIGLHGLEVEQLVLAFEQLLQDGHTVVIAEHHLDMVANADYLIDLGPEGGENGGQVLVQGMLPEVLARRPRASATLKCLRSFIGNRRKYLQNVPTLEPPAASAIR